MENKEKPIIKYGMNRPATISVPFYTTERFQREVLVKKLFKDNRRISVHNIKIALHSDIEDRKITEEVIAICKNIIRTPVIMPLPIPNTESVKDFSTIAGREHKNAIKIAGCYHIYWEGYGYVGHSIKLRKRIKDHAKGKESATKDMIEKSKGDNIKVRLYICNENNKPDYLSTKEFIIILEQCLLFHFRPTNNITVIARPGISFTPKVIERLMKVTTKKTYVYWVYKNSYYLLYIRDSRSSLSNRIGDNNKWATMIIHRGGFYRAQLFLSISPLDKHGNLLEYSINPVPCLHHREIVEFITWLSNQSQISSQPVVVMDVKSNIKTVYSSIRETAKALHCDIASIHTDREKPFRNQYFFQYISSKEYIEYNCYPPFSFWDKVIPHKNKLTEALESLDLLYLKLQVCLL